MIGAGALANAMHYSSLASLEDVEIVGTSDLNAERLAATAERFGISNRFSEARAFIDAVKSMRLADMIYQNAINK